MPRSFDFSVESAASIEQIYGAFATRDYWLARIAEFGGTARLEKFAVDSNGLVLTVVANDLRPEGLPRPVAKIFPREWRVVQEETWSPVNGSEFRGRISTVSHGAPGGGSGTAVVVPTPDGSRMKCKATVEFKVPLIGGQIENLMGRSLIQSISILQDFTTSWIADNF
ncbi:DUF2505 domain-containing protein [Mycolicibacterium confluentis]|uniref:DUF2505 domain-containing protein n=1 Tax=Mycolicibacterium confluentis TaxID=28047 RepID=UPI000A1587E2|nr:DUF2505 domain-containing protein [Mycolicibacterium confluentis]MCV7322489.1 DUF2505 domain-containing protein [Mycolicibacterium confluentis]ORV22506.1 hypothetical protein AWB99_26310 [Mycolicibacterium confluentis]